MNRQKNESIPGAKQTDKQTATLSNKFTLWAYKIGQKKSGKLDRDCESPLEAKFTYETNTFSFVSIRLKFMSTHSQIHTSVCVCVLCS